MSPFLYWACLLTGESLAAARSAHSTSRRRLQAFALALHLPLLLWAFSSYGIATNIFHLKGLPAALAVGGCLLFVYLIERLVLLGQLTWFVGLARAVIALAVAFLGAVTIDLLLFEPEIQQQFRNEERARIESKYLQPLHAQEQAVERRYVDWQEAIKRVQCEVDRRCGTGQRGWGRAAENLQKQADDKEAEYKEAQTELRKVKGSYTAELAAVGTGSELLRRSGFADRVAALHDHVFSRWVTTLVYFAFLLIILAGELMVLFTKWMFRGETTEEKINKMREESSLHTAKQHFDALTSRDAGAKAELRQVWG